jgi:predicted porin
MNKKLMAVAVASALAAPGVALAQASSVTISGFFKASMDQVAYSRATSVSTTNFAGITPVVLNPVAGTTLQPIGRAGNQSETRLSDNSSRIIFGIREDLGNGLAAVAQLDQRFETTTLPTTSGDRKSVV